MEFGQGNNVFRIMCPIICNFWTPSQNGHKNFRYLLQNCGTHWCTFTMPKASHNPLGASFLRRFNSVLDFLHVHKVQKLADNSTNHEMFCDYLLISYYKRAKLANCQSKQRKSKHATLCQEALQTMPTNLNRQTDPGSLVPDLPDHMETSMSRCRQKITDCATYKQHPVSYTHLTLPTNREV